MSITIYHNSDCSTSRRVLNLLREAGIEPKIVKYLKEPPSETRLKELIKQMGIAPRELLRKKERVYAELGLDASGLSDADLIAAMAQHPRLIERPIVATDTVALLCRPPERVYELLPTQELQKNAVTKNEGEQKKPAAKARRSVASATYIMRASVAPKIFREFEIPIGKSLYNLAEAIVSIFEFDFDHAFGFYSKLNGHIFDSPRKFLLFVDLGDVEDDALGVEKTKIVEAFPDLGEKMTFLFDYGDEWRFLIEVIGAGEREPKVRYPKLLKSVGKAPEQYPDEED
jgi:arsenate reductase (glutaredoxin)